MRFVYDCPVRWSDMDAYGHVNNVRFLTLYEEARVALMFVGAREAGVTSLEDGIVIFRHEVDYLRPVDYGAAGADRDVDRGDAPVAGSPSATNCSPATSSPAGRARSACRSTWPTPGPGGSPTPSANI